VAAFTAPQLQVLCGRWGHDANAKVHYIRKAMESQGAIDPSRLIKVQGKPSRYTTIITSEVTQSQSEEPTWARVVTRTETALQRELEQTGSF
jgi:hypothetical protein